jgi:hypothetical protein
MHMIVGSLQNLIFKSNAFRVVFLTPDFCSIGICKDLEMVDVADFLARVDVDQGLSLVPLELALSPVMWLPMGIVSANVVAVQCLHDADAREHRWAFRFRNQDQRLDRGLPCRIVLLGL